MKASSKKFFEFADKVFESQIFSDNWHFVRDGRFANFVNELNGFFVTVTEIRVLSRIADDFGYAVLGVFVQNGTLVINICIEPTL